MGCKLLTKKDLKSISKEQEDWFQLNLMNSIRYFNGQELLKELPKRYANKRTIRRSKQV